MEYHVQRLFHKWFSLVTLLLMSPFIRIHVTKKICPHCQGTRIIYEPRKKKEMNWQDHVCKRLTE